jgi:putative tryptophan/tyrosine transport system substrate-binding protein
MRLIGLAVVLALSLVLTPHAEAQQPRTIRIGFLGNSSIGTTDYIGDLRQGLRELGYVEGDSFTIEPRFAGGKMERLPELPVELVRMSVDIIVASGPEGARAAQLATRVLPIVVAVMHEPVAYGLIASFARPGGNVTGLAFQESELVTKQLQLLHEAFPQASRVAVLYDPSGGGPSPLKATEHAARAIGLTLKIFEVRAVGDFPRAFEAAKQARAQALLQLGSPPFGSNPVRVAELTRMHRLPAMCEQRTLTVAGCLMSYGPNFSDMYRRAAYFVDKILKGAKPGDLPVEQPTKFELVINLKTAKALGVTIPQTLLLRADQVIE